MNIGGILIGILLASIGLTFIFLYTNLLTLGYTFFEFVKFINTRVECLLFLVGIGMILYSMKGRIKNELFLRHTPKL